jgi:hypothetical protein
LALLPNGCHQSFGSQYGHHSPHIIGQHMQIHFGAHILKSFSADIVNTIKEWPK